MVESLGHSATGPLGHAPAMKLIVGLGNPGSEYAKTRHNVGFMAVERLAQRHALSGAKTKFHAGVIEGPIGAEKCVLMQPVTYMNRSGKAVAAAMQFYKLALSDLLIIVDDVALPCGTIRLRKSGSAGGHNGLLDIERALGSNEYPRLRIGIDAPGRAKQVDYVLGKFTTDQLNEIDGALDKTCNAIESWIGDGIDKTMNVYNAAE